MIRCCFSGKFADLPSEVILMREISAGVPINDPIAPAVIPIRKCKYAVYKDTLTSQISRNCII